MMYHEYKAKDAKELQGMLAEARGALTSLRFQHSIGQLKNTKELASIRTRIAHILTALRAQR